MPITQPTTAATIATSADSPRTIRRTCRGVAPTRRSRPSWRRRVATTNPKVLPTTKIAMNTATPDMMPNRAARSDELRAVLRREAGVVAGVVDRDADRDRQRQQCDTEGHGDQRSDVRRPGVPDRAAGSARIIIVRARSSWRRWWRRRLGPAGPRPGRPRGTAPLWAYDAASGSWVTITTVWPRVSDASRRSSRTRRPDARSRAPVGSSANSTSGRRCSARAMATRCCCPPESSGGRRRTLSSRPTSRSASMTAARSTRSPASRAGQRDVLVGRQRVEQVVGLEDERHRRTPQLGQLGLLEPAEGDVADEHLAAGRPVETGGDLEQRGLAGARTGPSRR